MVVLPITSASFVKVIHHSAKHVHCSRTEFQVFKACTFVDDNQVPVLCPEAVVVLLQQGVVDDDPATRDCADVVGVLGVTGVVRRCRVCHRRMCSTQTFSTAEAMQITNIRRNLGTLFAPAMATTVLPAPMISASSAPRAVPVPSTAPCSNV